MFAQKSDIVRQGASVVGPFQGFDPAFDLRGMIHASVHERCRCDGEGQRRDRAKDEEHTLEVAIEAALIVVDVAFGGCEEQDRAGNRKDDAHGPRH